MDTLQNPPGGQLQPRLGPGTSWNVGNPAIFADPRRRLVLSMLRERERASARFSAPLFHSQDRCAHREKGKLSICPRLALIGASPPGSLPHLLATTLAFVHSGTRAIVRYHQNSMNHTKRMFNSKKNMRSARHHCVSLHAANTKPKSER